MKKNLLLLLVCMMAISGYVQAQAPLAFNYQGVARNNFGTVINNKTIGIRFTIHDLSTGGTVVYSERHTVNTDQYGVFALSVGSGTVISGAMNTVPWGVGSKFLQVEMDPNGGTSFINMGTVQLNSVPFSILAGGAPPIGPAGGELTGTYPNPLIKLPLVKTQSDAGSLIDITNSGAGAAIAGVSTGTGFGGLFTVNNAASTADALRVATNGVGASWGIRSTSTGTNGAGLFISNNATANNNNLQSNTNGLGRAGLFNSTNAASASNGVDVNVAGTGFALRAASTNAAPKALQTAGGVQLTGIGEALNRVLISDAAGNATWQTVGASGAVTGSGTLNFIPKWTPSGTVLGNSLLFDNGTNVGVGTITPTHRLEVNHSGSTGIVSRSTAAFSVVDIDAANGDAALRYQSAGATKWNVRNAPGTNDYQIIRNNSLPANVTINNTTGFVGITQATPAYQLDVLHAGATGIRSQSSSTFSVIDIDAANGDAALRFQKAGTGQWNTRNRPADDYYEIFELGGGGSRFVIQDGSGFVGIGGPGATASPAYQLDVEHGGATGIRSRSSSTFSLMDIDAANGDAALRFARAGVNQWNIRNRPADDYLEIFELGGGGSRVVVQDGTGNVGIGETTSPSYKLDVLHGGATGIRSRSSSTFSLMDIDAANGDAALRFAKAGVNQWNTRNRPADDYYEIFELGGGGSRFVIQDGTGNVGIGETTSPSYKLDVLHGGATGARIRSSSTFSIFDIDADNGDAAIRFARAGVNQWNVRNRPADDYFEIFELGGGGSRVVIQDGSGNVGIGETTNPTYKLDVLHGGATGIRSRSSGTFSLIDIDGANGDAALRFAKAGVNQWNIRNNPANDDLQIFELGGGGERMRIENGTGNVVVNGNLSKGGGSFKIDHPLDPANKYLYHSFVESPDMMNIYNGNITTDASGKATVKLPDYFEALNMEFRYQLTVMGTSFAQAIVSKKINGNVFEVATNQPNIEVSWMVTGVRHDAYANQNRIPNTVDKAPQDKGKYLHPKAFDLPMTKAINYMDAGPSSLQDNAPVLLKAANPANTTGGSLTQGPIVPPVTNKAVVTQGTSLDQQAITPAATNKAVDKTGSVADMPAAKKEVKTVDKSGSVADVPAAKKEEKKPAVPEKGGSTSGN